MDIICLSSAYWDEPLWTNKQHIMSRLANQHRIVYVEPGLFSKRHFLDTTVRKPQRWFKWLRRETDNLWIVSHLLPIYRGPVPVRHVAWRLLLASVRSLMNGIGMAEPVLWIYQPEAVRAIGQLGERLAVYDCVDEYTGSPYYRRSPKHLQALIKDETELLRKVDLVITTSQPLYDTKRVHNPNTVLAHNVADVDHFARAVTEQLPTPDDLAPISAPILGFVGAISNYKMDFELVCQLAQSHPEWQIVLIGPVGEGDRATSIDMLAQYENIHILGFRKYDILPHYVAHFDVCIIPYRINSYTTGVFPMKFFEFLAAGKAVVSTALPSLKEYAEIAYLADNHGEFIRSVERALAEDCQAKQTARIQVARANSWNTRIGTIMKAIFERMEQLNDGHRI